MSFFYKKSKTLVFSEEIIQELSKELGIEEKYIEDIIDTNIKYVKQSVREKDDILLISFPNLGKLTLNYYLSLFSLRLKPFNMQKKVELLQKIMREGGRDLKNFKKPLVYKFGKKLQSDVFNDNHVISQFNKIWEDINIKYDEKISK